MRRDQDPHDITNLVLAFLRATKICGFSYFVTRHPRASPSVYKAPQSISLMEFTRHLRTSLQWSLQGTPQHLPDGVYRETLPLLAASRRHNLKKILSLSLPGLLIPGACHSVVLQTVFMCLSSPDWELLDVWDHVLFTSRSFGSTSWPMLGKDAVSVLQLFGSSLADSTS